MDMDPGLQAFKEESHELLGSVEDILLQLEAEPDNNDLVNELFRAVHTIKGASGLFGFDDVVSFTHQAESVMGRLRDGELQLNDALTTLFLDSRDHILLLVDDALNGSPGLDEENKAKGIKLHDELGQFLNNQEVQESQTDETETAVSDNTVDNSKQVDNDNWHISLRFGQDVLRMGMEPQSFLRYLQTIGDIVSLTTLYDDLPDARDMDPESCYLGFEIDLKSEARKEDIEGVFEFVQEDCVIHILPPYSHIDRYIELIKSLPEEDLRIGDILTMTGVLTQRELEEALAAQNEERQQGDEHIEHPLGEVVVEQGVVETQVVQAALDKQQQTTAKKAEEKQSIRVSADKLSEMINLVGELVIASANTEATARQAEDDDLIETTAALSHLVEEIRDTALSLRMVEIGTTFSRFRRVVREVSRNLGKDIDLIINGGDTELDKIVIDKIADPLMHLVRNSLDHGIEMPEQRREKGKPAKGTLKLNAVHDSGSIVITISDDGNGLPKEKILSKALERGLIKPDHNLSDKEINKLIFEPGFSTADEVTDISGRGVGMDVVRRNIDALRGQVDVDSTPGAGSTFSIRLPLTLAIIDGFLTRVGQHSYVIPLDMVDECIEYQTDSNTYIDSNFINLRGEVLPYVRLGELFDDADISSHSDKESNKENIIVTNYAGKKTGFIVNELLGEYQTVIKPLGDVFKGLKGISGATILGSGEVAMIIDVPELVQRASFSLPETGTVQTITNH